MRVYVSGCKNAFFISMHIPLSMYVCENEMHTTLGAIECPLRELNERNISTLRPNSFLMNTS